MDQRVARLKTSKDALALAANAERLGNASLAIEARARASVLRASEEGFVTPAQLAVAQALYAYEEEQSRLTGRRYRANRTRQMMEKHSPLGAAERTVLVRKKSSGFRVLEEAGREELSFEAIIDRFPDEFSNEAVAAARARLRGEALPPRARIARPKQTTAASEWDDVLVRAQRLALDQFDATRSDVSAWSKRRGVEQEDTPKKSGIAFGSDTTPHPAKRARNVSLRFGNRIALLEWLQTSSDVPARLYVITEGGTSPSIPVGGLPYESSAGFASGRLRVIGSYSIAQAEQAIDHYLSTLAEFAPRRDGHTTRLAASAELTPAQFAAALDASDLPTHQRRWLTAHYYAPEATASMEWLARELGHTSFRAANSQYGGVVGRVVEHIAKDSSDLPDGPYVQHMQWVATLSAADPAGHAQWQMRPAVRLALELLGWVEQNLESDFDIDEEPVPLSAQEEARRYGLSDTEVRQMMLSRRGQGRFRQGVLRFWGDSCAVTGLRHVRLLVASHIKPWKAANPSERLDGFNGLPLSPNLDKLFDRGLITFETDGRIRLSANLDEAACVALGIGPEMALRLTDKRIEAYMAFHRAHVFKA